MPTKALCSGCIKRVGALAVTYRVYTVHCVQGAIICGRRNISAHCTVWHDIHYILVVFTVFPIILIASMQE